MARLRKINEKMVLKEKLFSVKTLSESKINFLHTKLHVLSYQEMICLSRMEDFYFQHEYLTEKQIQVLSSLVNKHSLNNLKQQSLF